MDDVEELFKQLENITDGAKPDKGKKNKTQQNKEN